MNTTTEPTTVRGPLGWDPVPTPPRRTWLAIVVPLVLVVAVLIGSMRITLPYYAMAPGSARSVDALITPPKDHSYPPKGEVLLTTVSLYQVTPLAALVGWLRSDIDVLPEKEILPPDTSDKQYQQYNLEVMDESKQTAVVVALRRLGYQVPEHGEGGLVEKVLPSFPADGRLAPGDIIHSIDGSAVTLSQDASAIITKHKPGDVLDVVVSHADGTASRTVQVPVATDPQQGGKPVLGVLLRTYKHSFDMPFDVKIASQNIGGPSAGLAFTLGVLDELTPGELTGGKKVAATGTIEIDGTVGDVGGVAQKTAAVKAAGAKYFLVPPGEYATAKAHAGSNLRIIKVATLQQALDALASIGGDLSGLSATATAPK
ncbi:MAG TPA: PDZ domain-containing protein [Acidimicrobiales bacterium]|nr:PDZ domain-containing protein [Acidimicrobiales bacterium]